MKSIEFWGVSYENELKEILIIIKELEKSKARYEGLIFSDVKCDNYRTLKSIQRYLDVLTGFVEATKNYKIAIDDYFIRTFSSYSELVKSNEKYRKRAEYLSLAMLNKGNNE